MGFQGWKHLNTSAPGTAPSTAMPSRRTQDTLRWTGSPSKAPEASSFLSSTSDSSLPSEGFSLLPKPCGKRARSKQLLSAQLPSAGEQLDRHRLPWGAIPNPPRKGRMVEPRLDAPMLTTGQGTRQGGGTAAVRDGGCGRWGGHFPGETRNGQAIQ